MNKIIVLTGSIVGIAYLTVLFIAWYSAIRRRFCVFEKQGGITSYGWAYYDGM
jgi:molybdopterin-containing oxidoreductase family membrane subunit